MNQYCIIIYINEYLDLQDTSPHCRRGCDVSIASPRAAFRLGSCGDSDGRRRHRGSLVGVGPRRTDAFGGSLHLGRRRDLGRDDSFLGGLLYHGDHGDWGTAMSEWWFFPVFFVESFLSFAGPIGQASSPTLGGTSQHIATIGGAWLCISFCSEYTHSASTEIIQPNMWYTKTMAEWLHVVILAVISNSLVY